MPPRISLRSIRATLTQMMAPFVKLLLEQPNG
jgi:hypothetical protein